MSYALGYLGVAPGDAVGPYTVDSGQLSLFRRVTQSWGAWPDADHPQVLHNNERSGPTMSTAQALVSLKYQVAAAGAAALVLGGTIGYFSGRGRRK
jgi:hypothetical protein